MYKDHIEHGYIAQKMLCPELVVTETGWAGVGDHRGGDQGENRAAQQPEIADIKQFLVFTHDHITGKYHSPAANGNGQVIYGVGP